MTSGVSRIQGELDAERDRVLADIQSIGASAGVPKRLLPSIDNSGERIRVSIERGRRTYSLYFEDRGYSTILSAPSAGAFLEQIFRRAMSSMADEAYRSKMSAGMSPSEVRFETWAELLGGVRPEWGERLRRSKGELLGLPGSLKL